MPSWPRPLFSRVPWKGTAHACLLHVQDKRYAFRSVVSLQHARQSLRYLRSLESQIQQDLNSLSLRYESIGLIILHFHWYSYFNPETDRHPWLRCRLVPDLWHPSLTQKSPFIYFHYLSHRLMLVNYENVTSLGYNLLVEPAVADDETIKARLSYDQIV